MPHSGTIVGGQLLLLLLLLLMVHQCPPYYANGLVLLLLRCGRRCRHLATLGRLVRRAGKGRKGENELGQHCVVESKTVIN